MESKSVLILGRQPALGLAELESLYGPAKVTPAGSSAALLDADPDVVGFARLGSSMKLGRYLARIDGTDWQKVEQYLRKHLPRLIRDVPEGKFKLGISAYGLQATPSRINATALTLKKAIRSASGGERSVRIVPNKESELNAAQVLHNGLTTPTGWELLLIRDGNGTLLARTTAVQDIDAYAARDQGRPKRDARVGMLPPKLAQTIVNLAAGPADADADSRRTVLDPFCGTGVVLQEALLMGYDVYGTDLEPRMVDYSRANLDWLAQKIMPALDAAATTPTLAADLAARLEPGDATAHSWQPVPDFVACEGYLGQPFGTLPTPEKLEQVRSGCNLILRKFLQNIGRQLPSGTRLCLAVPAWQRAQGEYVHLPALDRLEELGYNRLSFEHVRNSDLVYARADQIVARELLVLTKR